MMSFQLLQAAVLMTHFMATFCFLPDYPSTLSVSASSMENHESLPRSLAPSGYYLKLFPRIAEDYFSGSVLINITCEEPTYIIAVHAHQNLSINTHLVTVKNQSRISTDLSQAETSLQITSISRDAGNDTLVITLLEELQNGSAYQVYFEFNSSFSNTENVGFFRSVHGHNTYVGTFMALTNARRVFPCFDEPFFKAPFQISIAHLSNMTSLSVMPRESTEMAEEEGWVWDHFAITPPLSTFSINVFVSNLLSDEPMNITSKQGAVSVQFHHGNTRDLEALRSVVNVAPLILEHLRNILGVAYPTTKLDIVALPNFNIRERANSLGLLLIGESFLGQEGQFVIHYDLIYQVFNHMVTPLQSSDFEVTNYLGSYFGKNLYFKVNNVENWSVPLSQNLYFIFSKQMDDVNPRRVSDYYIMSKGAWFFRMLNYSLTENTFRRGITNFLSSNLYHTFTEDTLWSTLTDQARLDGTLPESLEVKNLAHSWINKDSFYFPLLTLTRNYEENTAVLEQHVFCEKCLQNLTETDQKLWWRIPLIYLTPQNLNDSSPHPIAWTNEEQYHNISDLPGSDSFIIMNPADSGMFLVNYDQENWRLISQFLMTSGTRLPITTRVKLMSDAFILALQGELDFGTTLNMTMFHGNEADFTVALTLLGVLGEFDKVILWTSVEDRLTVYFRELLVPIYKKQPHSTSFLVNVLMFNIKGMLCGLGYQPCMDHNRGYLNRIVPTFLLQDTETQTTLFCPEFLRNHSSDWSNDTRKLIAFVHNLSFRMQSFVFKNMAKCPGYTEMIERIIDGRMDLTNSNLYFATNLLTGSPMSYNKTLHYLIQHFDELKQRFDVKPGIWTNLLKEITGKARTQEMLNKVLELYSQYKDKFQDAVETVENSIEKSKKIVILIEKKLPSIEHWLEHVLPHFNNSL